MGRHYTVKDVAKLAGVSPSTVSLTLNNSNKVKSETKEKVLKAAKELKYIPNEFAVTLRQKRGELFGVLVPDMTNPYYINIVSSIKRMCDQNGIRLQIMETLYDLAIEDKAVKFLKSVRTTGYVFIGTHEDEKIISSIQNSKIIFIDKVDESNIHPVIIIDNKKAMYEVTKHIISKGCKNIFYITQTTLTQALAERQDGFIYAMKEGGLDLEDRIVSAKCANLYKLEAGYEETKKILKRVKPDAVITSSDLLAIGSISAIIEKGLSVPDDILVTGFDNIDYTRFSNPTISTINQPCNEMGKAAFEYLTGQTEHIEDKYIIKDFEFIKRESTNK